MLIYMIMGNWFEGEEKGLTFVIFTNGGKMIRWVLDQVHYLKVDCHIISLHRETNCRASAKNAGRRTFISLYFVKSERLQQEYALLLQMEKNYCDWPTMATIYQFAKKQTYTTPKQMVCMRCRKRTSRKYEFQVEETEKKKEHHILSPSPSLCMAWLVKKAA